MNALPPVWQAFLDRALGSSPRAARGTMITQHGEMRLDSGKWIPFTAEQSFEAARTGFCWHARARMAPLVTVVVEDAYENGHGRLEAKVFGIVPVAKGTPGVALDRGELIRYLGEVAWNPMALLFNPELRFSTSPEGAPRLWMHDEATYVDCTFDAAGDLVAIHTKSRERDKHGPTPWSARYLAYGDRGGVRVPVEADVSWDLPDGPLVYWRGKIDELHWAE